MSKIKFSGDRNKNKTRKKSKWVSVVITFHPILEDFGNIIDRNLYLLYMDQEAQKVFMPGPMITFLSARILSNHLVRTKLHLLERTVGSCKCYGKRREICDNVIKTSTFTSTVTQNGNFSKIRVKQINNGNIMIIITIIILMEIIIIMTIIHIYMYVYIYVYIYM